MFLQLHCRTRKDDYFDFTLALLTTSKQILQQQLIFCYPLNRFDEVRRYRTIQPMLVLYFLNASRHRSTIKCGMKTKLRLITASSVHTNNMAANNGSWNSADYFLQIIYRLCALTAAHPAVSNHSNSNYSVSQKKHPRHF